MTSLCKGKRNVFVTLIKYSLTNHCTKSIYNFLRNAHFTELFTDIIECEIKCIEIENECLDEEGEIQRGCEIKDIAQLYDTGEAAGVVDYLICFNNTLILSTI